MKERPILDERKTQTRRIVKKLPLTLNREADALVVDVANIDNGRFADFSPYGQPGDRMWVQEAWKHIEGGNIYDASGGVADSFEPETLYRASRQNYPGPWKPSIHMPRWASRITLEITSVRVERLHDITEADAMAEGVERTVVGDGWRRYDIDPDWEEVGVPPMATARQSYSTLWNQIHHPSTWTANPWVWVVEFKKVSEE